METEERPKLEQGNLIVITWYDAIDDSSWQSVKLAEIELPAIAKSVGWFLNQDEICIRLVSSVSGIYEGEMDVGKAIIPKCMIKSIEVIREDELDVEQCIRR